MDMFYYMIIWDTVVEATGVKNALLYGFYKSPSSSAYAHRDQTLRDLRAGKSGSLSEKNLRAART
jgi:hypothetical protein